MSADIWWCQWVEQGLRTKHFRSEWEAEQYARGVKPTSGQIVVFCTAGWGK